MCRVAAQSDFSGQVDDWLQRIDRDRFQFALLSRDRRQLDGDWAFFGKPGVRSCISLAWILRIGTTRVCRSNDVQAGAHPSTRVLSMFRPTKSLTSACHQRLNFRWKTASKAVAQRVEGDPEFNRALPSSRSGGQGRFRGIPPELTELIVFVEGFGAKPTRSRLLDKCSSNRGLPVNWPLFLGSSLLVDRADRFRRGLWGETHPPPFARQVLR